MRSLLWAIMFVLPLAAPVAADGAADAAGGDKAFEAQKYELAIELYTSAINSVSLDRMSSAGAFYDRGRAYHRIGKFKKARADYERAIRANPDEAEYYVALGKIRLSFNATDGARSQFDKALKRDKENADAYLYRCWAYARRGALRSMKDCRKALELRPDHAATLDARAYVYWQLGETEAAKGDLARARELDPSFAGWQSRFKEFERKPKPK